MGKHNKHAFDDPRPGDDDHDEFIDKYRGKFSLVLKTVTLEEAMDVAAVVKACTGEEAVVEEEMIATLTRLLRRSVVKGITCESVK